MLNIINLLKKNEINRILSKKKQSIYAYKKFIPLSKEWNNSIYTFDKNSIRFLPAIHNNVFKLFKSYFNMFNKSFTTKRESLKNLKFKYSNNKVWVSTPEIKHLNEKKIVTIYVYNRLYNKYKKQLDLAEFTWGEQTETDSFTPIDFETLKPYKSVTLKKEVNISKKKRLFWIAVYNKKKYYINMIKLFKLSKHTELIQYKSYLGELIKKDPLDLIKGINIIRTERYNYLIDLFKKELIYIKLKQKILFNKFKFNELYLYTFTKFLETIYKKNLELNIVVLKNFYLSSSILTQLVVSKVKKKKYRGRSITAATEAISGKFIPNLSGNKLPRIKKKPVGMRNIILNELVEIDKEDLLNTFLLTNSKRSKIWSSKYIDNLVLKNIENKSVAGIFIKLKGRLTRRYKAQRAINIFKYKGTLKNPYSAHTGLSSTLSRGYANINIEKSTMHSKVRVGAFGMTGWIASY